MVLPGILVIFTPLILGGLFGPKAIAGYLAGVIVSGVQMAISSSNSGGAWDNAKKFIEGNNLIDDEGTKQNIMKDLEQERADKPVEQGGLSLEAEAEKKFNSKSYDSSKISYYGKHSEPHKAAVVGDTVGDPLKDTSGPSLNILIKLSAIVSLVFGSFFENHYLFKA
jgi:Na+/H+-translocating membrane pyrophosphatase